MLALAEQGDARSMLGLARMRLNPGLASRHDPTGALDWLTRAAEAGSDEAQFDLARIYEQGLGVDVDEARALLAARPPLSPEASKVMGLQDLTALIEGEIDEAECKARIVQRTRRFARKQMTFFRGFDALTWIEVAPDDDADTQAAKILAAL